MRARLAAALAGILASPLGTSAAPSDSAFLNIPSSTRLQVVGLRYSPDLRTQPASLGVSVNNLGQGAKLLEDRDPPPTALHIGGAAPLGSLLGVVQFRRLLNDVVSEFGAGLEAGMGAVALRGGWQGDPPIGRGADRPGQGGLLDGLALGMGIRFAGARVDYAMNQAASKLGSSHRITLTLRWGPRRIPATADSRRHARPFALNR